MSMLTVHNNPAQLHGVTEKVGRIELQPDVTLHKEVEY